MISIALLVATVLLNLASNKAGEMVSGGGGSVLVDAAAFALLGGLLVAHCGSMTTKGGRLPIVGLAAASA
jgi:hypothetical protein